MLRNPTLLAFCLFFFIAFELKSQDLEQFDAKKPVKVTGSVGGQAVLYKMQGATNRRQPFSYVLSGNLNFTLFNIISVPLSFTYSEQQRGFQQPFNQIGFSPQYKWLTLHGGYRSIKWGDYTLGGFNFLLGGFEVQTTKLRAGFVYGRLNKATHPDTSGETAALLPAYKRMALAAKIGYGKPSNFVDLVFLNSWDVGDSIVTSKYYKPLRPAENRVVEITTQQKFAKDFTWKAEYAMSATNLDKIATGAHVGSGPADFLMKLNNTGGSGAAYNTSLNYRKKAFNLDIGFKHIDQNYKSFGGYYFNANYDIGSLSISYALFKNKLRISHTLQVMDDNANHKKNITTLRIMPGTSFDITVNKKLGINLRYNLVNTKQTVHLDTFKNSNISKYLMNQNNHMISFMPRYITKTDDKQHMLMLMETFQTNVDANPETKKYSQLVTLFTNLTYNLTFLKTGMGINASVFQTRVKNYAVSQNTLGVNAGLSKAFDKIKMNLATNVSYSGNEQNSTINWTINMNWKPGKHHNFTVNTSLINFHPKSASVNTFTEEQARIMYFFTF